MKLEASKQKFKKSFIISLFFSILYTSPLLAVDYVYDNSKLTNEQIDRLKKLRDKSSEYWKQETYLLKPTNGSSQNSLKVPALYSKTHQFKNINNSKKISFYDKEYTEDYLVGFARGFGVEKRNGEEEKPLRQYFKDCVNTGNSNNDKCRQPSLGSYAPIRIKSDIFALAPQIKNSHINSEILSVGNYIEWLRPTLNQLSRACPQFNLA